MKEKDYDELTREDEIFEDYNDLGALNFGGKSEKDVEKDQRFVEENLWNKVERAGKKISFAKDVIALFNYMRDPLVSWHRKSIVVAALIYFISPIDAIPDIAPLIGYLDDLGVITALLKFLGSELIPYYEAKYRS